MPAPETHTKPSSPLDERHEEAAPSPGVARRACIGRGRSGGVEVSQNKVERAWEIEAARRLKKIRAGRSLPSPWEEARARIFAREPD